MAGFDDIAEVVTCSRKRVNAFLGAGYRLLAVETESLWTKTPKGVERVEGYVLKHLVFVVGRPADVEPFDPEAKPG
jgi:hypothetical protein